MGIYLQRFPPQHRHVRRLVFDYLLKRECSITGCDDMQQVDLLAIGSYTELPGKSCSFPPWPTWGAIQLPENADSQKIGYWAYLLVVLH